MGNACFMSLRGKTIRLSLLLVLLGMTGGCVAKFGGVAPAAGRAGEAFSTGAEVMAPLLQPAAVGERGMMVVLPYEENRRLVEHAAGLSSGAVRMQSLGVEFRLLQLLFFSGERQQDEPKTTTRHSRVRKKRTEKEPSAVSLFLGIGPEYHWNAFNVSEKDLASAGSRSVFYEEDIRDCWGGRISVGLFSLSRSKLQKKQGEAGGCFIVGLSFHWTYGKTVLDGISGGAPFRRSRRENMQWLSLFIGFGLGF
jgi:hypothetical protein